jgi:hypothetical protein
MAGVRVDAVLHVLWIEPEFNKLYDHGKLARHARPPEVSQSGDRLPRPALAVQRCLALRA